jgi:hypothetical protein
MITLYLSASKCPGFHLGAPYVNTCQITLRFQQLREGTIARSRIFCQKCLASKRFIKIDRHETCRYNCQTWQKLLELSDLGYVVAIVRSGTCY